MFWGALAPNGRTVFDNRADKKISPLPRLLCWACFPLLASLRDRAAKQQQQQARPSRAHDRPYRLSADQHQLGLSFSIISSASRSFLRRHIRERGNF
jgi:hypothetical protein